MDVSRSERNIERFTNVLKTLAKGCFAPIAAGGSIRKLSDARQLLRSGADKVVLNSVLFDDPKFVIELAQEFGQQCVVGSIDIKRGDDENYHVFTHNGMNLMHEQVGDLLGHFPKKVLANYI